MLPAEEHSLRLSGLVVEGGEGEERNVEIFLHPVPSGGRYHTERPAWDDPCFSKSLIRRCYVTTKTGPGLRSSPSRLFCLLPQALQQRSFRLSWVRGT